MPRPQVSPHQAEKCDLGKPHSQRSTRCPAHPVDDPSANTRFADIVLRRLRERTASVLLFREGLSEEAATPEFPETRRGAFLKTLPVVHPREPPVTASSVAVASRLNASHVCTVSTLREYQLTRNGKLTLSCAKTVDDETSLWKEKENREDIPACVGRTLLSDAFDFASFAKGHLLCK